MINSHWVIISLRTKPHYPHVIKFGRSVKKGRKDTVKKQIGKKERKERDFLSSQWQRLREASEMVKRRKIEKARRNGVEKAKNKNKKGKNPHGKLKEVGSIQKWKLRFIHLTDQKRSSLYHS